MTPATLEQALQAALAPRDLLTHPFYRAWSAGELRADGPRALRRAVPVPGGCRCPSSCGGPGR